MERQRQERSDAVEHALVDFAGAYKELFIQAADDAATDANVLVNVLFSLSTQISTAKAQAQKEQQRLDDLAEWEQRQPLWDAFTAGGASAGLNPFVAHGVPIVDRWMNKPSETPITPPTITANFEPRGRIRTSGGSSEDTSSARPNLLRGFVATSQSCNRILDEELSTLQSAWSAFRTTCSWVTVDSFTLLNGFADYLVECETDAQWIYYIADAFEVAGGVGLLDSVLNGMAASALVPAMSDPQLLKRLDQEQLAKLFESSPALANQLHLIDPVTINEWWHGLTPGDSGQQNTVVHALPQIFGNLEGIPYAARATAVGGCAPGDIFALQDEERQRRADREVIPGADKYKVGAVGGCAPGDSLELMQVENDRAEQREIIPGDSYFPNHPPEDTEADEGDADIQPSEQID
ncbi:hypothetical protein A6F49_03670 [Enteractinococcus helveticum]|uniref:Uncharacterized protein n=1 Tax=Enteractinococcus helveticum TaxID=1837282 RepID=A0A1B7M360_9MICC|nr:hypothetical protein A6F49_03670 [Enteractinococcus helveticum]